MSDSTDPKSGTPTEAKSGADGDTTNEIKVDRSPEELAKRLVELSAENKKFRQKASSTAAQFEQLQSELNELRESKLKEQGEWKKMYEDIKSKYDAESTSRKKDRAAFVYRSVTSQFATEAAKAGCTRVDDLIKLATADGILNELEVSDEDFSVAPDSLKTAIERAQKQYPYLYAKQTPTIRDGVPSNQQTPMAKKDISKMDVSELIAMAKSIPN